MERNQVGGNKEGDRSMKCNTCFIVVIEKLLWNLASVGKINLHSQAQTKLYGSPD